jgi:predicted ATPase
VRRADRWHLRAEAMSIVPVSIQELVDHRLGRLSNDSYCLLEVAAVIGTSFSVTLLQAVTQGIAASCWTPLMSCGARH